MNLDDRIRELINVYGLPDVARSSVEVISDQLDPDVDLDEAGRAWIHAIAQVRSRAGVEIPIAGADQVGTVVESEIRPI